MRREKGFSLIELMIVITIIGILAALAVPAYTRYLTRSRIAEVFGMLNSVEPKIIEFHGATGNFPPVVSATADPLGLGALNSKYVQGFNMANTSNTSTQLVAAINTTVFGFPSASNLQIYLLINAPATPGGSYSTSCFVFASPLYMQYFPASCPQDPTSPTSP